jgi:predicted phage tail protein
MEPFRLARGCRLGIAPSQLAFRRTRTALRRPLTLLRPAQPQPPRRRAQPRRRRVILALTAIALTAVMAGWTALLAASGAAGFSADVTSPTATSAIASAAARAATSAAARAGVSPADSGTSVVLTAMVGPQARILNPGAPTGLVATAADGQVTLSWKAPVGDGGSAISGYNVFEGTSSGGESGSSANTGLIGSTSYTVTGLTDGTTYYFTATAVNAAGLQSSASNQASATPVGAPGAPTGLSASAGDAQVTLSWNAPASDGGEQITGYDVFRGSAANFKAGGPVATPSGTSETVKGLTNGTTYYFEVSAVNDVGAGSASGSVSATPAAAITAPGAPGRLTATGGKVQVILSWTAPGSTGGAAISGYIVYKGSSPGGESASPVTGSPVKGTSYTVTGLANATTYYFKVAAVNAAKQQGKDSGEASAKTLPVSASSASASASASASQSPSTGSTGSVGAAGIPGAPGGLTATPGNAEARLSWNAPASDGGSPVVSYRVYQGISSGFALTTPVSTIPVASTTSTGATSTGTAGNGAAVTSSTSMSTTVTGLTNGTTYYFVVAAVSADGKTSGASNEASAEPSLKAVLTSASRVPRPVIISLAAVAVIATVAALALTARLLRPRSKAAAPPPADVRAVPDPGLPPVVSVHEYGAEETYTVRLEPLPAAIITTLEEIGS